LEALDRACVIGSLCVLQGQDSLRYRDHLSFTNRIVTGAESFAATKPVPRKSLAVFCAESAGNTLLIAL
jgi:hypothetical protein